MKKSLLLAGLGLAALGGLAYRYLPPALSPAATPEAARAPAPAPLLVNAATSSAPLPVEITGRPRQPGAALPASLAQALGQNGHSFDARLRALHALGAHLGAPELAVALDYLRDPAPTDGLKPAQRAAFKNDLVNALRAQAVPPPGLTDALLAVATDAQAGPVLRDYALQHLSEWRTRATSAEVAAIDATFWNAAASAEPLAGTALLALCRQAEGEGSAAGLHARVVARAHALATDPQAPLPARVTALSVAGRLDPAAALPVALHIATTESGISLLAAAVPILRGHRDDPAAHAALQTLSAQATPPVRRLAFAALR